VRSSLQTMASTSRRPPLPPLRSFLDAFSTGIRRGSIPLPYSRCRNFSFFFRLTFFLRTCFARFLFRVGLTIRQTCLSFSFLALIRLLFYAVVPELICLSCWHIRLFVLPGHSRRWIDGGPGPSSFLPTLVCYAQTNLPSAIPLNVHAFFSLSHYFFCVFAAATNDTRPCPHHRLFFFILQP